MWKSKKLRQAFSYMQSPWQPFLAFVAVLFESASRPSQRLCPKQKKSWQLLLWPSEVKIRLNKKSGERVFNLGKVRYHNTKTGFATSVRMNKGNYEFLFPQMKTQEKRTAKKEEVATDSSNQAGRKKSEEKSEKKDKS